MCEQFFPSTLQKQKVYVHRLEDKIVLVWGFFFSSFLTEKCFLLPTRELFDVLLKIYGEKRKLLLQIMLWHV